MDELLRRLKQVRLGDEASETIKKLVKDYGEKEIYDVVNAARDYLRLNSRLCPQIPQTNVHFYESRPNRAGLKLKFFLHIKEGIVEIAGIRVESNDDA